MNPYVWWEVEAQIHSLACGYSAIWAPFIEKTALSTLNCLGPIIGNNLMVQEDLFSDSQFYVTDLHVSPHGDITLSRLL